MKETSSQAAFRAEIEQTTSHCFLCGQPTEAILTFVPNSQHKPAFGALPGKTRTFFYGLCESCLRRDPAELLPEVEERIETWLAESFLRPIFNIGKDGKVTSNFLAPVRSPEMN